MGSRLSFVVSNVIICGLIVSTLSRFHSKRCISCVKSRKIIFLQLFSTFLKINYNCHLMVLKWSRVVSGLQRVVFEPYWHPYQFWWKNFFDFKMTYLKLFFASGLQLGLKMAIYDGLSRTQVVILGLPMRPCAWKDEDHDHIKLFTWAFCEKIISRKNFEKKFLSWLRLKENGLKSC